MAIWVIVNKNSRVYRERVSTLPCSLDDAAVFPDMRTCSNVDTSSPASVWQAFLVHRYCWQQPTMPAQYVAVRCMDLPRRGGRALLDVRWSTEIECAGVEIPLGTCDCGEFGGVL